MAEHIWTVLCRNGVLDKYTNQVSLHGIVENINLQVLQQPPPPGERVAVPIELVLVSLWWRSKPETPETVELRFTFVPPSGKRETLQEMRLDLTEHQRSRAFLRINALPYFGPGLYHFLIHHKQKDRWKLVTSVPFEVEVGEADHGA